MVRTCRKPGVQVDLFNGEPPESRPAWRVIEAARHQHLTGELALPSNPPTNVYLINGEVYFAERTTDGGIGVRLLVEGVITRKQMSKGSVMVSGAEHLGRLFERDETIDRHAVELCVELMTDDVLTSVSKEMVDSYVMTLYKRHSSGIDRWLPNHSTADAPPVNEDQRTAAFSDLPVPHGVNGAAVHQPPVAQPLPAAPVVEPVVQIPVVQAPVVQTPVVQTPAPAPAPVQVPVVNEPVPVLAAMPEPPARVPERVELDAWPTQATSASKPPVLQSTTSYPPAAAAQPVAADSAVPSTIADEVADAVRRALAAIDSVLTPADDHQSSPPTAGN